MTKQEIVERIQAFRVAARALESAWDEAQHQKGDDHLRIDEVLTAHYPFANSFEDVCGEIVQWAEDVAESIGEKEEPLFRQTRPGMTLYMIENTATGDILGEWDAESPLAAYRAMLDDLHEADSFVPWTYDAIPAELRVTEVEVHV